MAHELGGSQISALLEAVPGIANVLRSPVADALVSTIRAAAGIGEFRADHANELVQYAVRRGLVGPEEGDRLLVDLKDPKAARRRLKREALEAKRRPKPQPVVTHPGMGKKAMHVVASPAVVAPARRPIPHRGKTQPGKRAGR